ncbi:MAG: porin [Rhizobacter sp.]|nr:porin [Rhizobacter sp.]
MNTPTFKIGLLATAALLASGSAQAQSSVVLYGLVDLAVDHYKAGSASGAGNVWKLNDGVVNGLNGSRWGVRVSEDLGGGLKANAVLESGLSADNGTLGQGGLAFGRQVFVGLSQASLGELRMGRQYILSDSVMGLTNPYGNASVANQGTASTNAGRNLPFWLNAPRANNVIQLATPNLGGFTGTLQLAPGEGTADRFHGVKLGFGSGPFNIAASYEWNKSRTTGEDTNKSFTFGANYNFGPVKLLGGIQMNQDLALGAGNGAFTGNNLIVTYAGPSFTADEINGYSIGVQVPVDRFTFGANYSGVKYENAAGANATLGKAALMGWYTLSKSTFLYSGVSFSTGDLKDYIAENRVFQAGIRMAW